MPSGDTLIQFTPLSAELPSSAFATLDRRNGHPVLDFDANSDEAVLFSGVLPRQYFSGGITALLVWMSSTATSGSVRWEAAIERHDDEGTDLDTDSFAAAKGATASAPTTNGAVQYTEIGFADGAEIDGLGSGESFRIKIRRDADHALDTMVGDAELLRLELRET